MTIKQIIKMSVICSLTLLTGLIFINSGKHGAAEMEFVVVSNSRQYSDTVRTGPDTVRTGSDMTVVRNGDRRQLIIQAQQNWYDAKEKRYRKYDLKIREKGIIEKLTSDYDYEVENSVKLEIAEKLNKVKVEKDGDYVIYEPVGILSKTSTISSQKLTNRLWNEVDVEIIPITAGYKENLILKTAAAPILFKYKVSTNLKWSINNETIKFAEKFLSRITAEDKNGDPVDVTINRLGDIVIVSVDTSGAKYPITVDPTVEWQHGASYGKDNYFYELYPTHQWGTSRDYMAVDENTSGATRNRGIIEFDSLQYLPFCSIINKAELILTVSDDSDWDSDSTIAVHRVTTEWSETVSCWDSARAGVTWTTGGGDYSATDFVARPLLDGIANGDTVIFNVTDMVHDIVNGTYPNYGWLIKVVTPKPVKNLVRFHSSEATTASYRPKLIVNYLPPEASIENFALSDSTHKSVTAEWDTFLVEKAAFDSFAVVLASDNSTRISDFTAGLTISIDTLTALTNYEFIVLGYNADTVRAYSSNTASFTTDSLPIPYNLQITNKVIDSVFVSVIDTSGSVNLKALFYDTTNTIFGDTFSYNGSGADTLRDTLVYTGKYDSLSTLNFMILTSPGDSAIADTTITYYQLANYGELTVVDTTDTTIYLILGTDSNPDRVWYRIFDSALKVYLDTLGDTSFTDTTWYAKSRFDNDTMKYDVGINTLHEFYIKTRNSDSLVTGYFSRDSLWSWAQVPEIDSVFAVSKDSIFLKLDPRSNPDYTYFALCDSLTDCFYDLNNLRFRSPNVTVDSSWAWYTYSEWGDSTGMYIEVLSNSTYVLQFYSKDGNVR